MSRIRWADVLERAAGIAESYDTGVTLRQLFYRLVADGTLPNSDTSYKTLSKRTAEARRAGQFPELTDRVRSIHRHGTFDGPTDARQWLADMYRRDRTEGQPWSIYLGVEKAGIVEQLSAWFGYLGMPIVALGGYSSQSYVDEIVADAERQHRPAALLYAGDFDPSGEDIDRDFLARTDCFSEVRRVALSAEQVTTYDLPPQPGKHTDSRAKGFAERHGRLVQVELDAVPPDELRRLYRDALTGLWDESAFEASLDREEQDRAELEVA